MTTSMKLNQNPSETKISDLLNNMAISDFNEMINNLIISQILKGNYDEAIKVRISILQGRTVIA